MKRIKNIVVKINYYVKPNYYIMFTKYYRLQEDLWQKKSYRQGNGVSFFQTFAAFFWFTFFMFKLCLILNAKFSEKKAEKIPGLGNILTLAIILQIIAIVLLVLSKREANAKKGCRAGI